jgi:hypothetical protein
MIIPIVNLKPKEWIDGRGSHYDKKQWSPDDRSVEQEDAQDAIFELEELRDMDEPNRYKDDSAHSLKRYHKKVQLRVMQLVVNTVFGRGKVKVHYDNAGNMLVTSNVE